LPTPRLYMIKTVGNLILPLTGPVSSPHYIKFTSKGFLYSPRVFSPYKEELCDVQYITERINIYTVYIFEQFSVCVVF